jgi:RsiW-degrading membrane proteinase PrsW (M82 family)
MSNRTLFLISLVALPFFGIGIDLLRTFLFSLTSTSTTRFPFLLLFDAIISILFMLAVFWLSGQAQKNTLSKIFAVILAMLGLYIVFIPLLNGTIFVPAQFFPHVFGSIQVHRTLAGALLFVIGILKIIPKNNEVPPKEIDY